MTTRNRGHRRGGALGRWKGWGLGPPPGPVPAARMPSKGQPMTGKQASFLEHLCEKTGEPFNPKWTKAQASDRIDALKHELRQAKGRRA